MMQWLWPWLFVLLPLPILVQRFVKPAPREETALRAPFFEQWRAIYDSTDSRFSASQSMLKILWRWLIWIALVCACARPVWVGDAVEIERSGRDLMLAVDISGSMQQPDMVIKGRALQRIDAVKLVASEFIKARNGDRLGLILFGSKAYVQSPLSFDTNTVSRFLNEAQIGFAGEKTAIADAIGLAVKRLQNKKSQDRVLILLSDGSDTASTVDLMQAAKQAQQLGIRIYTIGVGADSMVRPGILGSRFGSRTLNPSIDLDEESLQEIANLTGGRYFRAKNPQELAAIYQLLDKLEPVQKDSASYRPQRSLVYVPALIALLLSFVLALSHGNVTSVFKREHTGV
ncbi:MAG: BatB protein [Gammaproteobacteria bacterium]|nr:MAG: BatB protein [Gammaproteobacteria bacterium]